MRRARIKAIATIPVRRKAGQGVQQINPNAETELKVPEKLSEEIKSETQTESDHESTPKITAQDEKKTIPETLEKINTIKEKENNNELSHVDESEIKHDTQLTQKFDNLQKVTKPSTEGLPVKTIQNRSCFMRPTPRLDGSGRIRRNSTQGSASGASASESEDDCKKSCSMTSSRISDVPAIDRSSNLGADGNNTGISNNIAKLNIGQKRRMVVSESARKLAEAKREFHLKHEKKSPDKSKLTMYDLIYYNPLTNPMKPKSTSVRSNTTRKISICSNPDKKEEELPDEPTEILVPQVKVGPNGQLIIDEQSLVIDQYKAQENIDRSDIIVDEDTTGNGFYKRRQKSKEWNKWETIKFYKALNTYGTDFLLMQSVFPLRSRQELKLKYKKEERFNANLVEKALRYQEFDTEALEIDLANVDKNERMERESIKVVKESNSNSKFKRKRCRMISEEINCENEMGCKITHEDHSSDENSRITIAPKTVEKKPVKKLVKETKSKKIKESKKRSNSRRKQAYKRKNQEIDSINKNAIIQNKSTDKEEFKELSSIQITKKAKIDKIINETKNISMNSSQQISQENDKENLEEENLEITVYDIDTNIITGDIEILPTINETENSGTSKLIHEGKFQASDQLKCNIDSFPQVFDGVSNKLSDLVNLKPGALILLKKECVDQSGTTLKVYSVNDDYDIKYPVREDQLLPVDLSPDIFQIVRNRIKCNE